MIIRRLAAADAALLPDLNRFLGRVFEDMETYTAAAPRIGYFERLLQRECVVALAALDGDEIIGALVGYELPKPEQERSEYYIYDLAVHEDRRREGIATALIDEFRSIAARNNGWVVFVQADHGDDPAIALYTKLGRREDVLHFDIDVG